MPRSRSVKLLIRINNQWIPVLTIPNDEISQYTLRPLKWLRYLGFVIYGQEGVLCTPEDVEVTDYSCDANHLQSSYRYSSQDAPRLVDPKVIDDRTSDQYTCSQISRAEFAAGVTARDETCVVSGEPRDECDAAYIIPHSKGDSYIENFTRFRGSSEADVIDEISDVRNGLLLYKTLHGHLGRGNSAFIKTPSFCLSTDDIPPPPTPRHGSSRLTLQHFHDPSRGTQLLFPHNQDARPPRRLNKWVPALISNFYYAAAVIKKWGSQASTNKIYKSAKPRYYKKKPSAAQVLRKRIAKQNQERQQRAERRVGGRAGGRAGPSHSAGGAREQAEMTMEDSMDLVMFLCMRSAKTRDGVDKAEKAVEKDEACREKVETWLQGQRV